MLRHCGGHKWQLENLPESVSLCCVYLVRQDEALGAECEQGCAQGELSLLLPLTGSPSALSPPDYALSTTVKHKLRVCGHRTQDGQSLVLSSGL